MSKWLSRKGHLTDEIHSMTGPDREKFMDDLTDHELLALAEECGIDMRDNPSRVRQMHLKSLDNFNVICA
jgi:hypothetical protein